MSMQLASSTEHECPATNCQPVFPKMPIEPSLALVVGIDTYTSVPQLRTAVQDARCVAHLLKTLHGFEVQLLDTQVTAPRLKTWLAEACQRIEDERIRRLLFYFAGHGFAEDSEDGLKGYLIPEDGLRNDVSTFISMKWVYDLLIRLSCSHVLPIFDCCFAGSFRSSATRDLGAPQSDILYNERYNRFIRFDAWQVLTSASFDELAQDVFMRQGLGLRELSNEAAHSPFADAVLRGLAGEACQRRVEVEDGRKVPDGVITATDLFQYVRDEVFRLTRVSRQQTPNMWPLSRHRGGEFVFLDAGFDPKRLAPAPKLDEQANPYLGLRPFEKKHNDLFFGREAAIDELKQKVVEGRGLVVVSGPSGTGKSSLLQAGLIPLLERNGWVVVGPMRPGRVPIANLAAAIANVANELGSPAAITKTSAGSIAAALHALLATCKGRMVLLAVDQFEELLTETSDPTARKEFLALLADAVNNHRDGLRVVLTVLNDYERTLRQAESNPLAQWWQAAVLELKSMGVSELREAIVAPADKRVLFFEPPGLVDRLVGEFFQSPGALPLLSFTLSQLYRDCMKDPFGRRQLREQVLNDLGGVRGALNARANAVYDELSQQERDTLRRCMLRMVDVEGLEPSRRRVADFELQFPNPAETKRAARIIERLVAERLLVEGSMKSGEREVRCFEPAHDAFVRSWDQMTAWVENAQRVLSVLPLLPRLTRAAADWADGPVTPRILPVWQAGAPTVRDQLLWYDHPQLEQAVALADGPEPWLNKREAQFVQESRALRDRLKRRRKQLVTGVILSLSVLLGIAAWQAYVALKQTEVAENETRKANNETRKSKLALSGALATQSKLVAETDLSLSLLLAAEGLRISWEVEDNHIPAAEGALRSALAGSRGLRLPGHACFVEGVIISPDSNSLVTHDGKSVLFWNLANQDPNSGPLRLLGHPIGDRFPSEVGKFSVDGRWLVTTSVKSGTLPDSALPLPVAPAPPLKEIPEPDRYTVCLRHSSRPETPAAAPIQFTTRMALSEQAITPDCRWLVITTDDGIRLWQLEPGVPLARSFDCPRLPGAGLLSFVSPNGRWLLVESDEAVELCDLWAKDPTQARLQLTWLPVVGEAGRIRFEHSFSPDAKWLVGVREPNIRLWRLDQADPTVAPIDLPPQLREMKMGNREPGAVLGAKVTPNNRWLFTTQENRVRVWDLAAEPPGRTWWELPGHSGPVVHAEASPSDRWLATSEGTTIRVWDLEELARTKQVVMGRPLQGHKANVFGLKFTPDAKWLVSQASNENRLWHLDPPDPKDESWELDTGEEEDLPAPPRFVTLLTSADSRWVVTLGNTLTRLWDLAQSDPSKYAIDIPRFRIDPGDKFVARRSGSSDVISEVSPNGHWLVTTYSQYPILWDLTWDNPAAPPMPQQMFWAANRVHPSAGVTYSPDGQWLAVSTDDTSLYLFNLTESKPTAQSIHLVTEANGVLWVRFSPDSRWLAETGLASTRLWRLNTGKPPGDFFELNGQIDPHFSRDGRWLVGRDGQATMIWDLEGDAPVNHELAIPTDVAPGPPGIIPDLDQLVVTPNGRFLATVGGGTVRLCDLRTANPWSSYRDLPRHNRRVLHLAVSPNGRWLASASDQDVRLWELSATDPAATLREIVKPGGRVAKLKFSPDGRWLVVHRGDALTIWEVAGEPRLVTSTVESGSDKYLDPQLAFNPNGSWLAGSLPGQLFVGEVGKDPITFRKILEPSSQVTSMAFSQNGDWLLALANGIVNGWFMENVRQRRLEPLIFPNRLNGVTEFALSPDGHWLATAEGGEIRLWDLTAVDPGSRWEALPVAALGITPDMVRLAFSPETRNTRWLATAIVGINEREANGSVQLWSLDPQELLRCAARAGGRNMTPDEWQTHFGELPYRRTFEEFPVPRTCDSDEPGTRSIYQRAEKRPSSQADPVSGLLRLSTALLLWFLVVSYRANRISRRSTS